MSEQLSLSKDKIKIVLFEGIHQSAVDVLEAHGYSNIVHLKTALDGAELHDMIRDAGMVGVRSRTQLTSEVLSHAEKLFCIGCFCIGTNQVDLDEAAEMGIPVFNAPHSNTRSVAELVIGQTIMLMRGIFPKSMAAHRGDWHKTASNSHEVRGKTIGIVGYGHIGSQVSVLAEAMGLKVIYYDVLRKLPLGNARAVDSLEALLREADVVTLHVPADESTHKMIRAEQMLQMKKGASYLINASRGTVVDVEAMAELVRNGHLLGGAVDVFPKEPGSKSEVFESPLRGMENVILTPHIGGSTLEAQRNIGNEVAGKLVLFSDRGTSESAVNFPGVNLKPSHNAHRILNIHKNKAGMLQKINAIVAEEGVNVLGQFLETSRQIGYVVFDIDDTAPRSTIQSIKEKLDEMQGTIRTRVLY